MVIAHIGLLNEIGEERLYVVTDRFHHQVMGKDLVDRIDELTQILLLEPPLAQRAPFLRQEFLADAGAVISGDQHLLPPLPLAPFQVEETPLSERRGHADRSPRSLRTPAGQHPACARVASRQANRIGHRGDLCQ